MGHRLKILMLEPFFGGSHKAFAEGLVSHSGHSIDLLHLPARFWKWRMRGAALTLSRKIDPDAEYDLIISGSMMGLSDFLALYPGRIVPPALIYFHENQLSYPLPGHDRIDYQFGFTNIISSLAAQQVVFNSQFHRDEFLHLLPGFLKMMPEYEPLWAVEEIQKKSLVLYPGCDFTHVSSAGSGSENPGRRDPVEVSGGGSDTGVGGGRDDSFAGGGDDTGSGGIGGGGGRPAPLVIWNHRWEFDKKPEDFFFLLRRMKEQGYDFRLAVLGESFQTRPDIFLEAQRDFRDEIVHFGFIESRREYLNMLQRGDVVVSTSIQENFGYSVVEAIRMGCIPLLPNRLSYPEIIPESWHSSVLYHDPEDAEEKLARILTSLYGGRQNAAASPQVPVHDLKAQSSLMDKFSWSALVEEYDTLFEETASRRSNCRGKRGPR